MCENGGFSLSGSHLTCGLWKNFKYIMATLEAHVCMYSATSVLLHVRRIISKVTTVYN